MHTNATTTKPKDEITVILLSRMSNYTLIQMSCHGRSLVTTIKSQSISMSLFKYAAFADQNILTSR